MFHEEKLKLVLVSTAIQANADFYLYLCVTLTLSGNIDLATKSLFEIQLSLTVSAPTFKDVATPMFKPMDITKASKYQNNNNV